MRLGGIRTPNCTLTVPRFGTKSVVVSTLGYGMNIVGTDGIARSKRTYYPFVRTSGTWFIEVVMADVGERADLSKWLVSYMYEATNPGMRDLPPMVVTVPSEEFKKVGYPTGTIDFGEAYNTGAYRSIIKFSSASDALAEASRVLSPSRDGVAKTFYPSGSQSSDYVEPKSDVVFRESVWDGNENTVVVTQGPR